MEMVSSAMCNPSVPENWRGNEVGWKWTTPPSDSDTVTTVSPNEAGSGPGRRPRFSHRRSCVVRSDLFASGGKAGRHADWPMAVVDRLFDGLATGIDTGPHAEKVRTARSKHASANIDARYQMTWGQDGTGKCEQRRGVHSLFVCSRRWGVRAEVIRWLRHKTRENDIMPSRCGGGGGGGGGGGRTDRRAKTIHGRNQSQRQCHAFHPSGAQR